MAILIDRIGETRRMNNGLMATIIRYRNAMDIDVEFENGQKHLGTRHELFKKGKVRCPVIVKNYGIYCKIINPNLKTNPSFLVDSEDLERVMNFGNWCTNADGYIINQKEKTTILLHRFIAVPPNNKEIDHINGDKSDNRKLNLRACNNKQNIRNRLLTKSNTSGYKGVSWINREKEWQASICVNRKQIYLGIYDKPEQAAEAYNRAALLLHGEFARINKI